MSEQMRAEAARQFSQAADLLVDACRKLEQLGMEDPPVERLLQALEDVTHRVHQMHPPEERVQIEPADMAIPGCRIAAMDAEGPTHCTLPPEDHLPEGIGMRPAGRGGED
ncbi:MAG: hypothetical protein ACOY94_12460 [Bacillota bacterium]